MRPETTAIVFQGMQRDFCAPGGKLHDLLQEQLASRNVVALLLHLLDRASRLGVQAFFVPIEFTPDHRELRGAQGILGAIRDAGALVRNTDGARILPEFEPWLDRITVVPSKRGLCAFGTTPLDSLLKAQGIASVAVCGLLTNVCVETTARSAFDLGYEVILLAEVTATKTVEEQLASERYAFPLLGRVMTVDDFLTELSGPG